MNTKTNTPMGNEPRKIPDGFNQYSISPILREELRRRYSYHAPIGNQAERYAAIRAEIEKLAVFIAERAPVSRELSTAFTHLDSVMFYANAAIARNEAAQ